jgi:hypothetical protein
MRTIILAVSMTISLSLLPPLAFAGGGVNQSINNEHGSIGRDAKNIIEGDVKTGNEDSQTNITVSIDADYFKDVFGDQKTAKPNSEQVDKLIAFAKGAKDTVLGGLLKKCKGNIASCVIKPN